MSDSAEQPTSLLDFSRKLQLIFEATQLRLKLIANSITTTTHQPPPPTTTTTTTTPIEDLDGTPNLQQPTTTTTHSTTTTTTTTTTTPSTPPRPTPKSLIDRIEPGPLPQVPTISSDHSSPMDLECTLDSCDLKLRPPSPKSQRRLSSPSSPPSSSRRRSSTPARYRSSTRSWSRNEPSQPPSRLARSSYHRSTRPSSPALSQDSRRRPSKSTYESYHPPARSATYRSRSRSPCVTYTRRRDSSSTHSAHHHGDLPEDRRIQRTYMEDTAERPSYTRLISILRALQGPSYRDPTTSEALVREFARFTSRAETAEERILGYLYDAPYLLHRFLAVARSRRIITYVEIPDRLRKSTVKLDLYYR